MTISFLSHVHEKEKAPFSFLTKHALFKMSTAKLGISKKAVPENSCNFKLSFSIIIAQLSLLIRDPGIRTLQEKLEIKSWCQRCILSCFTPQKLQLCCEDQDSYLVIMGIDYTSGEFQPKSKLKDKQCCFSYFFQSLLHKKEKKASMFQRALALI